MNTATSAREQTNALHSEIWFSAPKHAEWILFLAFVVGLPLYAMNAGMGQFAADLLFVMLFIWLMVSGDYLERYVLMASLLLSTVGEVLLSLVFGLYEYKFHNVPLCVPPGHALFMTLGILASRRMPDWVALVTPFMALPVAVYGLWQGADMADAFLYVGFALFMAFSRARRFYATMFIFSLILEIFGTWLGVWTWRPIIPGTGITSSNPPLCAGTFYCMLDFLVLGSLSMLKSMQNNRAKANVNA